METFSWIMAILCLLCGISAIVLAFVLSTPSLLISGAVNIALGGILLKMLIDD